MKPAEVNGENESKVWKTLFSYQQRHGKFIFEVGDKLRVSKQRLMFAKSYLPARSEEIFTVSKRNGRQEMPVKIIRVKKFKVYSTSKNYKRFTNPTISTR